MGIDGEVTALALGCELYLFGRFYMTLLTPDLLVASSERELRFLRVVEPLALLETRLVVAFRAIVAKASLVNVVQLMAADAGFGRFLVLVAGVAA